MPETADADAEPQLDAADQQLSQDFTEALGFIKSSIAKMDRLISAILNLTREGRREFRPVLIDTRELIEGIVSTVAHQAAEAEAQIRLEPLPQIVSDRLALEQIFSNLIDNALKYLRPGVPGDIAIRGREKFGFAIFEVTDNGRGIDPEGSPAHLRFVPPRRNPGSPRPGHRAGPRPRVGPAARRNHVGRLGARRRLHLHHHPARKMVGGEPGTFSMSKPVTIIMVEDDEGHARLIERNIRRSGVNNDILPFTNGTAALDYLFGKDGSGHERKGQALLILLDLNLPDMSGIDILRKVKENDHLKCAPVVVLTTTDDAQEVKRCYELGCNVYITKPVNYESFANAIRQLGLFFSVIQVPQAVA